MPTPQSSRRSAKSSRTPRPPSRVGPAEVLSYGLALNEFAIRWCDDTLKEMEKEN